MMRDASDENRQHSPFPRDREEVRVDVLRRLAELAMSDQAFRDIARDDLPGALETYGFALTPRELAMATRFRDSLAAAGVDLDLVDAVDMAQIDRLLRRLGDR